MNTATTRPSVFVSYNHQDEAWKKRLVKQLRVLELEGDLEIWDDRRVAAGDDWLPAIETAMARARAAVLLISPDFLTSGFIRGKEVPEILRRRESEGLRVIPVIVHPCAWTAVQWLSKIQCRPIDGKELDSFTRPKAEKHLADLALEIRNLLVGPPRVETRGYQQGRPSRTEAKRISPSLGDGPFASPGFQSGVGPAGPPLHNLPYPRLGDLFTGRQEELDALATGGTAAITQSAAISGLGGIGKTRLAVEYAWRSGNRYNAKWFVRADSPENLRRNLAALAGPELMNLPEWETQVEDKTGAAVKRWLREHAGWLMILDNVDTLEAAKAVLEVLPSLSGGHVLITSRLTTWPATVRKQSLDKLSREDAVHFLLHRTEKGREPAADDAERAADLAEALDGLPLALEQAAAFILRRRLRLVDYLQTWERERSEVLKWHDPRVMEYPVSVAATWQQTFHQLSPTAATLLRLMAFLAPDPIPLDIFEDGSEFVEQAVQHLCEEIGEESDDLSIRDAFDELAEYSMISRQDGGMATVHRVVQEVLRSEIQERWVQGWIEKALKIVHRALPAQLTDFQTWSRWHALLPHLEMINVKPLIGMRDPATLKILDALIQRFSLHAAVSKEITGLMQRVSSIITSAQPLEEAAALMHRIVAIREAFFGNENPKIAGDLYVLARILQKNDQLEEAARVMHQSLRTHENVFGLDHPNTRMVRGALATIAGAVPGGEEDIAAPEALG